MPLFYEGQMFFWARHKFKQDTSEIKIPFSTIFCHFNIQNSPKCFSLNKHPFKNLGKQKTTPDEFLVKDINSEQS